MISSATLPPSITPTLPQSSTLPPFITPTLPESTTPPAAPGTSQTTTPSGLIVVRHELTPVTRGSQLIIADKPLSGDGALDAAKAAHAELAAKLGAPAADILAGGELQLAEQVRADEIRQQAIAALLAGDLTTAAELISRT